MRSLTQPTLAALLALCACIAQAQQRTSPIAEVQPGQALHWQGKSVHDTTSDARQLQGNVSVVFVWSSTCAVCRSALPELRANANGWAQKPFTLITLNVDRQRNDWAAYEQLVARANAQPANMRSYWVGELTLPVRLPLTLVLDAQGKVQARYEGRMAPQAWDTVAELLL